MYHWIDELGAVWVTGMWAEVTCPVCIDRGRQNRNALLAARQAALEATRSAELARLASVPGSTSERALALAVERQHAACTQLALELERYRGLGSGQNAPK